MGTENQANRVIQRENVYCINKGINQSGPKHVKSLNSQGVKAFNFVPIKVTEVRKEYDSSEVTASGVTRNYTGETVPHSSPGLQGGTDAKLTYLSFQNSSKRNLHLDAMEEAELPVEEL